MDYRIIVVNVEHEESVVLPAALLDRETETVSFRVMKSASDPSPRTFVLRRSIDGSALSLIEKEG